MNPETAFWDTSALVPLCIEEATTREAHKYFQTYLMTVWWASKVEITSGLSRLHRMHLLTEEQQAAGLEILWDLSAMWKEVLPGDEVRETACRMLGLYSLRAADSFQLAAALVCCRNRPKNRIFICADRQLSHAAELAGFTVKRIGESQV